MKADTKEDKATRKRANQVTETVLSDKSPRRKERGYHWEINTRLDGKRVARKFFKYGSEAEKTAYVDQQEALMEKHGDEEREQAFDAGLQKEVTLALATLKPWGVSLSEAASFFANHLEQKANADKATIEQGIAAYLESMKLRDLDPKTVNRSRQTLDRFSKSFPERTLASLEGDEIQLWWEGLGGIVNQRNNRIDVNSFLNWCVNSPKLKGFKINPVPAPPKLPKTRKAKVVLSASEVRRLLKYADKDLLPVIVAQAFIGVRKEESLRLRWEHFDWAEKTLTIPEEIAKGGANHARINPIPENALKWLVPYFDQESGRVLRKVETLSGYDNALKALREEAGWDAENPWPRNALRRTFVSSHYASFSDVGKTAAVAGTSEAVIFRNYRTLMKPSTAKKHFEITPPVKKSNVITLSKSA